jgi:hypothetical protein
MFRAPIDPGWGAFGEALAFGVRDGMDRYTGGRRQRLEDDRYDAEMRRRARLDKQADQDRLFARDLQRAELGVVDEDEAYEQVPAISMRPAEGFLSAITGGQPAPAPVARGPMSVNQPQGVASSALASARDAVAAAQPRMERRLRPGVQRAGNLLVDPTRSLAWGRAEAAQRERTERAERLGLVQGLTGHLPEPERNRVIAQAVYGVGIPESRDEEMEALEEQLALRDRYDARADQRTASLRASSAPSPAESRSERNATLASIAAAEAWDAVAVDAGPEAVGDVAARIQQGAAALNITVAPHEARALAVMHMDAQAKRRRSISDEDAETASRRRQQGQAARQRHGRGPLQVDEAIRRRNEYARLGMNRGQAVSDMLDNGATDAEIMQVFPEVTAEGLARSHQMRQRGRSPRTRGRGERPQRTTPGAAQPQPQEGRRRGNRREGQPPATQGPGPRNGTQQVPNAGRRVTVPIDPALVSALADRIRQGATPQVLKEHGFSDAEIQAAQQATRR